MKWYVAKIVFKICNGVRPQFDEHLRLIEARGFEEALLKARILGIKEEDNFINDRQQPVKWEFVNVAELLPLQEIKDGLEVYSQIKETEEANDYVHYVHQKAASLQLTHSPAF
ncbi:MAG: DUF4288 domain-containing protein [Cyclobacteriaceae bacterium]|nr:DUF4288 domain-containing protein [Cyclobacteriaceae bacterium]